MQRTDGLNGESGNLAKQGTDRCSVFANYVKVVTACLACPVVIVATVESAFAKGTELAQCIGALVGSALLAAIFALGGVKDMTGGLGTNGLAGVGGNAFAGLLVEIVLTFIFVTCILGVTSSKAGHGSFGGLVIGLTLTGVHILGIGLTGTSVNPARSIGPAIVAAVTGNAAPLASLWVFVVGPLVGAGLAAYCYKYLEKK